MHTQHSSANGSNGFEHEGGLLGAARAPTSHDPNCPGAFATIIAGEEYAALALCLHHQLRLHGSVCPLLVVYSDVDGDRSISDATHARLATAVGASNVIPLTKLILRAQGSPSITWPAGSSASTSSPATQVPTSRARSEQTNASNLSTWTNAGRWGGGRLAFGVHKYWLWALDRARYPKIVYLDVDVIVQQNLDALVHVKFSEGIGAVTSAPLCQHKSINSGVLVLKPSLSTLVTLLLGHRFANHPWKGRVPNFDSARLGRDGPLAMSYDTSKKLVLGWPEYCLPAGCSSFECAPSITRSNVKLVAKLGPNRTKFLSRCRVFYEGRYKAGHSQIHKSCERHAWDQSVLNWHFSGNWFALAKGYNVQSQLWELTTRRGQTELPNTSVIHFAGEPKPWGDAQQLAQYGARHREFASSYGWSREFAQLARRWRTVCPADVVGGHLAADLARRQWRQADAARP